MKNYIRFIFLIGSFMVGCNNTTEHVKEDSDTAAPVVMPMADNSMNSLDWQGEYHGILPCADCKGIETTLLLNGNNTYLLQANYMDKNEQPFEKTGEFKWDEKGNNIQLVGITNAPYKYKVGENYLLQLDLNGNIITGNLADQYKLMKIQESTDTISGTPVKVSDSGKNIQPMQPQNSTPAINTASKNRSSIENSKWKLIEILGQEYANSDDPQKMVYFILDSNGKTVHGFSGCNIFNGVYEISGQTGLRFKQLLSTLRACNEMETDVKLMDLFERIDNYTLKNDILCLNKAKMATLARFKKVKD